MTDFSKIIKVVCIYQNPTKMSNIVTFDEIFSLKSAIHEVLTEISLSINNSITKVPIGQICVTNSKHAF